MDTMAAYTRGQAARGNPMKVFDWDKAARLIRGSDAQEASAGLGGDWEWTGGNILADGKPVTDGGCYLSSNWATPELEIDGVVQGCWCYNDEWNEHTCWPESALAILRGD